MFEISFSDVIQEESQNEKSRFMLIVFINE